MTMLLRSLLISVLLAAMTALSSPAPAQTPKKKPAAKKDEPIVTTSTVYYRDKGTTTWSLFGYYSSEPSARRVFEHLARTGYEVELRISNRPIPKAPPRPASA